MASGQTIIVGDIQGCYTGLRKLLDKCQFDPASDRLLAVGDLVARGEDSLATVDYLMSLGSRFDSVLGNHDLHLLSVIEGIRSPNPKDNLKNLLGSERLKDIGRWLRTFGLALKADEHHTLVHAGLFPQWGTDQLLALSDEVSEWLTSDRYPELLHNMYDNDPEQWNEQLSGFARLRFIINACTRMRFVSTDYRLDLKEKGKPGSAPEHLKPWFNLENKALKDNEKVVFGHWAALNGVTDKKQVIGLDTGYVWGNEMTAYCIETGAITHVPAK